MSGTSHSYRHNCEYKYNAGKQRIYQYSVDGKSPARNEVVVCRTVYLKLIKHESVMSEYVQKQLEHINRDKDIIDLRRFVLSFAAFTVDLSKVHKSQHHKIDADEAFDVSIIRKFPITGISSIPQRSETDVPIFLCERFAAIAHNINANISTI